MSCWRRSLPVSGTLGGIAFLIATAGGIWVGAFAAVRHNRPADTLAMLGALLAISIPTFVIGPLLILVFALELNWLPVGGWGGVACLILPAITLASPYVAYIARLMRTSMLEVLGQDFIRTARAKGLAERRDRLQARAEGGDPAGGLVPRAAGGESPDGLDRGGEHFQYPGRGRVFS